MIATIQEFPAKFQSVTAPNQGEAVSDLGTAHDREVGQEDLGAEISESGDVETHFSRNIRNHVKVGIIPLQLKRVLRRLAE